MRVFVGMGSGAPTRTTPRGEAPPRRTLIACAICWLAAWTLTAHAAPRERNPRELKRESARSKNEVPPTQPTEWQPSHGPECIKRGPNRGFCAGPRRVPKPRGEAADLAQRLGLGSRQACSLLLIRPPRDAWVDAAKRLGTASRLLWPVEESRLLRGIGNVRAAEKRRKAQFGGGPKKPGSSRRHAHEGLDIGAKEGAPIRAAQHGLVVYSDNALTGYGNLVIILHADASVTFYGHCRATYVFAGQRVKQGQVIGEVGHTGYARGSHVHFEYRVGGLPRDPTPLFAPHRMLR